MPSRSAGSFKRARTGKVSPKTKEANRARTSMVVASVVEVKGEIKVEEVIENKPDEEKPSVPVFNPVVAQGVYDALELRDGGSDYLGKSVFKERDEHTSDSVEERSKKSDVECLQDKLKFCTESILNQRREELKRRREEIKLVLHLFQSEMKKNLGGRVRNSSDEMLPCYNRVSVKDQRLLDYFCVQTQYFTEYFDFCDYLKNECKFIKSDSVAEEVRGSGELNLSRFDMISEDDIMYLLQSCIGGLRAKETIDLEIQYWLYLTECDFIKYDSDASAILGIIKEEERFKDMKFSYNALEKDLRVYLWYLDDRKFNCGKGWVTQGISFMEMIRKGIEKRDSFKWPSLIYKDCEMKLVRRAHSKGYAMDEDPLTEIKKFPKGSDPLHASLRRVTNLKLEDVKDG